MKLKFHQMKMIDVARTTESEIAEIERLVDVVFSFVVAIASIAYLIDFCFDVLIASITASVAVKKFFVFDVVKMNLMMIKS